MFFFISYRLPGTFDFVSISFTYSIDRMTKSALSLINETFPALNLKGEHLLEAGYIASKPLNNEDVWRNINLDGTLSKC